MVNQRLRLFARVLLVSGCCALSSGSANAQFGGKPYQQWTAKEAVGLLSVTLTKFEFDVAKMIVNGQVAF